MPQAGFHGMSSGETAYQKQLSRIESSKNRSSEEEEFVPVSEYIPAHFNSESGSCNSTVRLDTQCMPNFMGIKTLEQMGLNRMPLNAYRNGAKIGLGGETYGIYGSISLQWRLWDDPTRVFKTSFDILDERFTDSPLISLATLNQHQLVQRKRIRKGEAFPAGKGRHSRPRRYATSSTYTDQV